MSTLLSTFNPQAAQEIRDANQVPPPPVQEPVVVEPAPPLRETGTGPLPGIGDIVLYHPRGSEARRGRTTVPAIVIWRDEEGRQLELCIVHEANDVRQIERVREWPGGAERGWEAKGGSVTVNRVGVEESALDGLKAEVAELRAIVLGDFERPNDSILEMLDDLDGRLDALGKQVNAAGKPAVIPAKKKAAKGK